MKKKQVYEINDQGFIEEIYVAEVVNGAVIDKGNCLTIDPPHGLFKAKWTGVEWIEGATQEEIAELTKPQHIPPSQSELMEQRLADLELMLVEIMFK